ncbi:MAG: radical SAM family heme chaperone HemW [Bacteroidota bacterium]
MLGLYVHIPFCRHACHYCNFHFSTQLQHSDAMVTAIVAELDQSQLNHPTLFANGIQQPKLQTVYFGGGSPSVLTPQELHRIFEAIHRNFNLEDTLEITLEANPEDLNALNLASWKSVGINRLSIGIQSLNDVELQWMNRKHSAEQSREAVALAATFGFHNVSIDLIYGSEKKSLQQWKEELAWAADCGATHLSCYALTIEEKTTFGHRAEKGLMQAPPDEHAAAHFQYLSDWAAEQQWEHYEISNLSKPGHRAVHNSHYWEGHPYIGVGPSAHSFNGTHRRWNIAQNHVYMEKLVRGESVFEEEALSAADQLNERLMTGLRLINGVDLLDLEAIWPGYGDEKKATIEKLIAKEWLFNDSFRLAIPVKSRFLCDAITVELMVD